MSKSNTMPFGPLCQTFLEAFAAKLGDGAVILASKHLVVWRDGDSLNRLEALRWCWPGPQRPGAPRVTRIYINFHAFDAPRSLLRELGLDERTYHAGDEGLRLEWSVLGDELLAFADWLPFWIRGCLDPAAPVPLPPHPSHIFGQGLRTTSYAWTTAAWDAYTRWRGQNPSLPCYAIPAAQVTPATLTMPSLM